MVSVVKAGSQGFTLVELTIVFAIIGALVIIAFLGQDQLRSRARMTDAVDQTVNLLAKTQNDSKTALNNTGHGDSTKVFFADAVQFNNGSSTVNITPIWNNDGTLEPIDATTFTIPWSIPATTPIPCQAMVYARQPADARPVAYMPINKCGSALLDGTTYGSAALTSDAVITLNDGKGHCADITVKPDTGLIDKAYREC